MRFMFLIGFIISSPALAQSQQYGFGEIKTLKTSTDDNGILKVKGATYAYQGDAMTQDGLPSKLQQMAIELCGSRIPAYDRKVVDVNDESVGLKKGKAILVSVACNDATTGEHVSRLVISNVTGLTCKQTDLVLDAKIRLPQTTDHIQMNCLEKEGWIRINDSHMFFGEKGLKVCQAMENEFVEALGGKAKMTALLKNASADRLKSSTTADDADWLRRSVKATLEKRLNCDSVKDRQYLDSQKARTKK